MDSTNYYKRFSGLIEELIDNPLIEVQRFSIKSGFSREHINNLGKRLNIQFSERFINYYSQLGEVEISWILNEKEFNQLQLPSTIKPYDIFGEIFIQSLNSCLKINQFEQHWHNFFQVEELNKNQKEWIGQFKPFDFFNSDTSEIVGILQKGNVLTDEMGYCQAGRRYATLSTTFEKYIDFVIATKGLTGRQLTLNDEDITVDATFKTIARRLFPNLALDQF